MTILPDLSGWRRCAWVSLAALIAIALIADAGGLLDWRPEPHHMLPRLLKVLLVPALNEEVVFRGLLIPSRGAGRHAHMQLTVGVALFTLWHVVEALTILPGARLFLTPTFLACAAVLGAACAWMRYDTGSLWPAVALHGLVVWVWQTGFGGPDVASLLQT